MTEKFASSQSRWLAAFVIAETFALRLEVLHQRRDALEVPIGEVVRDVAEDAHRFESPFFLKRISAFANGPPRPCLRAFSVLRDVGLAQLLERAVVVELEVPKRDRLEAVDRQRGQRERDLARERRRASRCRG